MIDSERQFIRKANLVVASGGEGIDLSDLRFTFEVRSADVQSPNYAHIRVYNLSQPTMKKVRGEFDRVILQAGYEGSSYGVIFDGTIKQFRVGKENPTDVFLDIMAAEADIGYNFGVMCKTFASGSTMKDYMEEASTSMGVKLAQYPNIANPALARGRVGFGMARGRARCAADTIGATWSIQNGGVQVIELTRYLPGQAVEINSLTGMIGIPEQTDEGVRVRCLLNPKLRIGGLVKLTNSDITQQDIKSIVPFNVRAGAVVFAAPLADDADGLYRLLTLDHLGDSRGNEWSSEIVCLAVDQSSGKVAPYGNTP